VLPVALIVAALAVASTSEDTVSVLGLIAGVCWLGVGGFYLRSQKGSRRWGFLITPNLAPLRWWS